jgi:hypothetical protein
MLESLASSHFEKAGLLIPHRSHKSYWSHPPPDAAEWFVGCFHPIPGRRTFPRSLSEGGSNAPPTFAFPLTSIGRLASQEAIKFAAHG